MKPKTRMISLFLAVCLVWVLLPTVTYADDGQTQDSEAIVLGAGGINKGDKVYFGAFEQDDAQDGEEPVEWRVLDTKTNMEDAQEGDGLFLLSEDGLGTGTYGGVYFDKDSPYSNVWQGSDAQKWCQTFFKDNLTSGEQGAVLQTTKNDKYYEYNGNGYTIPYGNSDGSGIEKILDRDTVFFLSAEEAANAEYGFINDNARKANYAGSAGVWWLRSPFASYDFYAGVVYYDGAVNNLNVDNDWSARPAFNLDLKSVLFTSAAAGGKSSGAAGAGALQSIGETSPTEWKLTLKDSSRNFNAELSQSNNDPVQAGDTIQIAYSGAGAGTDDEYVSAILADDSGKPLYYGQLAQNSAQGTADVTIPAGLADGGYTLKVFSEQVNGDYKTDYASGFADLAITVGQAAENELVSITPPAAISGLANGTAKTAEALGLPKTVGIITSTGSPISAAVTWDVDSCSYEPTSEAAQPFTVSGTVTLPDGVANPDNVPLKVTISVSVSAKPAPAVSSISIKTGPDKTTYTAGETLDLTGLEVTIGYSGGDPADRDVAFADFLDSGISTSPAHGTPLTESDNKVTVTIGTSSASFNITVNPKGGDPGPDNPGGGDDKPGRPSGGSDGGSERDHDDENYDFWQDVKSQIQRAKSGDLIKVNAKNYDEMTFTVMEALYENSGVSLEIRWSGGETFTILAGQALKPEKNRIFYRLDYLAELYSGAQPTEQPVPSEIDPVKTNPNTGAGSWWDYLMFLLRSVVA